MIEFYITDFLSCYKIGKEYQENKICKYFGHKIVSFKDEFPIGIVLINMVFIKITVYRSKKQAPFFDLHFTIYTLQSFDSQDRLFEVFCDASRIYRSFCFALRSPKGEGERKCAAKRRKNLLANCRTMA